MKWELEQAVSDGRHKVIIALPIDKYRERRSPFSYEYVREVISDVLGCAMPRYQGNTQFIRFAASGEPILKSDTRTSLTGQIFGSLPGGLIEVLDEAGYDMRSYKHRLRVILISGALLGLLVWVRYIALNP